MKKYCPQLQFFAVFASSTAVFANVTITLLLWLSNKTEATGGDFFTNNEGGLLKLLKDGLNNVDADSTKQIYRKSFWVNIRQNVMLTETSSKMNLWTLITTNKDAKEEAKAVKAARTKSSSS